MRHIIRVIVIIIVLGYVTINLFSLAKIDGSSSLTLSTELIGEEEIIHEFQSNNINTLDFLLEVDDGNTITQTQVGTFEMKGLNNLSNIQPFNVFGNILGYNKHDGNIRVSVEDGYFIHIAISIDGNEPVYQVGYRNGQNGLEADNYNHVFVEYDETTPQKNKKLFLLSHGVDSDTNSSYRLYVMY